MQYSRARHIRLVTQAVLVIAMAATTPIVSAAIQGPLAKSVASGKDIFIHNKFEGRGMTCQSCHTAGGLGPTTVPGSHMHGPSLANAAAVFPRYKQREGKVMTLAEQIHGCIQGALGGKAPAYNSKTMTDLVSYITSLSQGKHVDMGAAYK